MSDENMFKDYCKAENTDDEEINSDLQAQLYAEIYYDSNIEDTLENSTSQATQHDDISDETAIANLQRKPKEKETTMSEAARDKSSKNKTKSEILTKQFNQDILAPRHCSVVKPSTYDDTLSIPNSVHSQTSTDNRELHLTKPTVSVSEITVQTSRDSSTIQNLIDTAGSSDYANCMSYENNDINEASVNSLVTEEKESRRGSSKKHKHLKQHKNKFQAWFHEDNTSPVYKLDADTKYNVLRKKEKTELLLMAGNKQAEDSSDSEESIFEVPIPPRPQPPLIDLQDSDKEDATNSAIEGDDLLMGRLCNRGTRTNANSRASLSSSPEVEIVEVFTITQSTISKNKIKPMCKDTSVKYNRSDYNTRIHEINEDIVLNCMNVRKGARSISEIKRLSKSTAIGQDLEGTISEDTNRGSNKKTLQNISRRNSEGNSYIPQEICAIPSAGKSEMRTPWTNLNTNDMATKRNTVWDHADNYRCADQDLTSNMLMEVSCNNSNLVMNRKRYSDTGTEAQDNPAQKRQCIIQQSDRNTTLASNSNNDEGAKGRKDQSFWQNYFFKPLPEELKRFYNNSRGQENFDIRELQRRMSRDPKIWAILDEDLMPSPARRCNRYWKPVKCSYCQQEGHLRKDCTEPLKLPCCHMCGEQGHTERHCPRKICLTCGRKQSSFRKTCEYCRVLYCTMCNSTGHKVQQCPDLWRRYHQTTIDGDTPQNLGDVMKPPSQLYCCNCARRGHEASTCVQYRWSLHFATPANVTNYTDGPTYSPKMLPNVWVEPGLETADISSPRTNGNQISVIQRLRNLSEIGTDGAHFSNADSSPTNAEANKQIPQGVACIPGTSEGAALPSAMGKSLSKRGKPTEMQAWTTDTTFTKIIYSCGKFRDMDNKRTRIMVRNLSVDSELTSHGKRFISSSLANGEVLPVFLKTLREITMFKATIGWVSAECGIMLRLITLERYVDLLSHILFYWFNLPHDEKSYGLNVNLSRNPKELLELYGSKMPLSIKNDNGDPLKLLHEINNLKATLKSTDQNAFTRLWDLQTELLMIVNTQPYPNKYIRQFWRYFKKLKKVQMKEQLDVVTYLQIIVNYNHLFVPHTPIGLIDTVNRILHHQKGYVKPQKKKQTDLVNASFSILPTTSCMSQNYDANWSHFAGNPSTMVDAQNANHHTSIAIRNVNDIPSGTSDATRNYMQHSQNIVSLNTQPILVPLEVSGKKEDQLSTGNIGVINDTNADAKLIQAQHLSKKARKKLRKAEEKKDPAKRSAAKLKRVLKQQLRERAYRIMKEARTFKLPYMINAADDLQRKIKSGILNQNHVDVVQKMIKIESKHQKNVNLYYSYLK